MLKDQTTDTYPSPSPELPLCEPESPNVGHIQCLLPKPNTISVGMLMVFGWGKKHVLCEKEGLSRSYSAIQVTGKVGLW